MLILREWYLPGVGTKLRESDTKRHEEDSERSLSLDKIIEDATTDAYGTEEQLTAWMTYLEDAIGPRCECRIGKKTGMLFDFDLGGFETCLFADVEIEGNRYRVDALTITIPHESRSRFVEAFKKWVLV